MPRRDFLEAIRDPGIFFFQEKLLGEIWANEESLKNPYLDQELEFPIGIPPAVAILKLETDGVDGYPISVALLHKDRLRVLQLSSLAHINLFASHSLNVMEDLLQRESPTFYSYVNRFVIPALKRLNPKPRGEVTRILGEIRDLSETESKTEFLVRAGDISGSEVPQLWGTNQSLCEIEKSKQKIKTVRKMRITVLDALAKHVALECLRLTMIYLKDFQESLNQLRPGRRSRREDQYEYFARTMFELRDYKTSAFWYSKLLSSSAERHEKYLTSLQECVANMTKEEILEYAVLATKMARRDQGD